MKQFRIDLFSFLRPILTVNAYRRFQCWLIAREKKILMPVWKLKRIQELEQSYKRSCLQGNPMTIEERKNLYFDALR